MKNKDMKAMMAMQSVSKLGCKAMLNAAINSYFPDPLSGRNIDILKEYELIKQKKSNLSARLRRVVSYRAEQILKEGK
jgi:hypothetical protein